MNLYKLIIGYIFIFPFLSSNFGECVLLEKLFVANQLHFYHLFLIPWMLFPKSIFLTVLLSKLIAVRNTVIVGKGVAVGALLLGKASGLILGTIGGTSLGNKLSKLQLLKKIYDSKKLFPSWHPKAKHGHGWYSTPSPRTKAPSPSPHTKAPSPSPRTKAPYYRWQTYDKDAAEQGSTDKALYYRWQTYDKDAAEQGSTDKAPYYRWQTYDKGAAEQGSTDDGQESMINLRQQPRKPKFGSISSKPELMNIFAQADQLKLKLLMEELSIPPEQGIPDFVPIPEIVSKSKESTRLKRSGLKTLSNDKQQRFMEKLIWETKGFFTILSTFDRDTCIQKLVCEVHAKKAIQSPQSLRQYDRNLICMFEFVNTLLDGDYQGSSMKYRDAAYFGEVSNSNSCRQRYRLCGYSSQQIIKMGENLD